MGKQIEVRAEDIPNWIVQSGNRKTYGITGEDLFQNYLIGNPTAPIKEITKIPWEDKSAIFGKPALCVLSDGNELSRDITVSIGSKYTYIVEPYLKTLENKGFNVERLYFNGSLELTSFEGIADIVIDIVYTGRTMKQYNLEIEKVLFTSDCVIIGGTQND